MSKIKSYTLFYINDNRICSYGPSHLDALEQEIKDLGVAEGQWRISDGNAVSVKSRLVVDEAPKPRRPRAPKVESAAVASEKPKRGRPKKTASAPANGVQTTVEA